MCGRYTLRTAPETVREVFDLAETLEFQPRFNIAPTQQAPIVRLDSSGERHAAMLRWGLVPSWAKDIRSAAKLINARSETVAAKPAFRAAFKRRRCLAIADGYIEWQTERGAKQPYHLHLPDNSPLGMAALWESWKEADDQEPLETFTIITTEATGEAQLVHDRMPVLLPPAAFAAWLDPQQDAQSLQDLLQPFAGELQSDAVNSRVNQVRNDDPDCLRVQKRLF